MKYIIAALILFLSILSGTIFLRFKGLIRKYSNDPSQSIEKQAKQLLFILVGVLVSMIALTLIAIYKF